MPFKKNFLLDLSYSTEKIYYFMIQYKDMSTADVLHCLASRLGRNAYWIRMEVGLLAVCWDLVLIYKIKVSREIAKFSSSKTRTYAPHNSGSHSPVFDRTGQYLYQVVWEKFMSLVSYIYSLFGISLDSVIRNQ